MSHEITATDSVFTGLDGQAWHHLDKNYGRLLTREEAEQHLLWTVSTKPCEINGIVVPNAFFTVRDDLYQFTDPLPSVLGVVGRLYKPIQNKALFSVLDAVIEEGAAVYEAGGSIYGGKRVWIQAKLPNPFDVVKDDEVRTYVTIINGHDGRLMCIITYSLTRVVCANTMAIALDAMGLHADTVQEDDEPNPDYPYPFIKIRHTPSAGAQMKIAHQALGLAIKHSDELKVIFQTMAAKAMLAADWKEYLRFLFPSKPETNGREVSKRIQKIRDRLTEQFDADINNVDPTRRNTEIGRAHV